MLSVYQLRDIGTLILISCIAKISPKISPELALHKKCMAIKKDKLTKIRSMETGTGKTLNYFLSLQALGSQKTALIT